MIDHFRKLIGFNTSAMCRGTQEKEFVYGFIRLPIDSLLDQPNKLDALISRLICAIDEAKGDVNQLCCDTILFLYGVPLSDPLMYVNLKNLVEQLAAIDEPLQICLGQDSGPYGTFGYEKRCVVTAIGRKMLHDYHAVGSLPIGKVHIRRELAERIEGLRNRQNVLLID